jgi:glycosyltransferase involved in cell wall biosynthesis
MPAPLVSVVLCCYNGSRFLEQQVDSILTQTYSPLELIISDDGSTDDTRKVLSKYINSPNITIHFQEKNIGLAANFAFASQKARGEYIAFSDQDDIWLPEKIQALVAARADYPLVYSDSLLVDESGNSLNKKLSDIREMYTGDDSRGYILYSCVWGHGMLITKSLLKRSLPMPAHIHHDIWLAFQAFLNGGIKYHADVLTHYRQHETSSSKTIAQKTSTRPAAERFAAYKAKLDWIKLMQARERPRYQPFYTKLLSLYSKKEGNKYVFPLFFFMLKYRKALFRYSKKGFFSQLVEIIKQTRAEHP